MDPYTEKLLERTRQRRELLNQKLGKAPEATPKKRVLENTSENKDKDADDDSPKRHCLRDTEQHIKEDTPAIYSVQSRMQQLKDQRSTWSDADDCDDATTVPVPKLSFDDKENEEEVLPKSRNIRLARLAENINNWEEDLTHANFQKTEEPKPRWQPPKAAAADGVTKPIGNVIPTAPCLPSSKTTCTPCPPVMSSPQKKPAPILVCPSYGDSPMWQPSPKPSRFVSPNKSECTMTPVVHHEIKKVVDQIPINAKGLDESSSPEDISEEPTKKPILERISSWKKVASTHTTSMPVDPALQTMSVKLATWEQKVSQTPTSEKKNTASRSKVNMPVKQLCTPVSIQLPQQGQQTSTRIDEYGVEVSIPEGDPVAEPVSTRMATWQQKTAKPEVTKEDEPTAYSVLARMSAWEHISSSQQVAHIKKVDPGTPVVLTPHRSPAKTPVHKVGIKTQLSFKDSIIEKAKQIVSGRSPVKAAHSNPHFVSSLGQSPVTPTTINKPPLPTYSGQTSTVKSTPGKTPGPPPIGSATKLMQKKLIEQTLHTKTGDMAERLRRERMSELQSLQNRWQNGTLKNEDPAKQEDSRPLAEVLAPKRRELCRRDTIKAEAKADFERKLEALGFEISGGGAAYDFKTSEQAPAQKQVQLPAAPPLPRANHYESSQLGQPATERIEQKMCNPVAMQNEKSNYMKAPYNKTETVGASSGCKSSIYRLISKREDTKRPIVKPNPQSQMTQSSSSSNTESLDEEDEDTDYPHIVSVGVPSQESDDDSFEYLGEHLPEDKPIERRPPPMQPAPEDGDVSLSAFVPESVRRASILPNPPSRNLSISSDDDDDDDVEVAHIGNSPLYAGRSKSNLLSLGQQAVGMSSQDSLTSLTSEISTISSQSSFNQQRDCRQRTGVDDTETEDDLSNGAMDDFLDEAMDEDLDQEDQADKPHAPVPQKRRSYMMATDDHYRTGDKKSLAYSVSAYRSQRNLKKPVPKARIIRKNQYQDESSAEEEEILMTQQMPPELDRKSLNERIQELQELVFQEQSVIMQTSNALNQCCSRDSVFAGSAEQVECNRLLLVSCQRRQAYLTEIQRLKESRQLEHVGRGPKGSITISDIRLPLKKEFVTKIGTTTDNTVHYFVILIRNGSQVILTQMLSTHDPMMKGSLDFPNLIKIHGISGNFRIVLEIYSMSISREINLKDKKKKTPAKKIKQKNIFLPVESPGGPSAVHTTSFMLITTLPLTMKCLDKSSFTLERIPYLSPLHGTIYLRLKCLMEQNVEERGFLTMFEDVSGLGAWHRRWCVLTGNKLCYWKYPDDESRKEPMGFIDLKRSITESTGLIPRDVCARPNTFQLVTVRHPRKGEQDTLITKTYSTMTTMKFMLSADTKEERIMWCNKINRALVNIRTWHSDAMRPIKLPDKTT